MGRKMAEQVVSEIRKNNGPQLTILEAMDMTKVKSDGYEIYAIQKGDVTFLAWTHANGSVTVKIQCW